MISVSMRTNERVEISIPTYLISDILEYIIFVLISNIAVKDKILPIRCLD